MYYIQGADQKEYGPVSADQLRQWIGENRLNRFSAARAEGESTWKTLGDFPEFAEALGLPAPVPMVPPTPPAPSASPALRPASYFIQGADQKEYGPIAAEQLRQWITENRLNQFSPARAEGEGTWKTLGDFPEFAHLLGGLAPMATPTVTATSSAPPASTPGGWGASSSPSGSGLRPSPGISESVVDEKLRVPAIGILITGGLGALASLYGVAASLGGWAKKAEIPGGVPPEAERFLKSYLAAAENFSLPMNLLTLILGLVTLLGGIRMLQRRSYGLVMTGVILGMLPCTCCCCLGLPFGIWALVVLSNPEVKAAFR